MQRKWYYVIGIGGLVSGSLGILLWHFFWPSSQGPVNRQVPPVSHQPTDEPIAFESAEIQAWETAGAQVGHISVRKQGYLGWSLGKPRPMELPGFKFEKMPAVSLNALPDPKVPFGICFSSEAATSAVLKELARFKQLHAIDLSGCRVTNADVKEIGGLKQLQILDLGFTFIGDTDVEALATLVELRGALAWELPGDERGPKSAGRV